MQRLLAAAITFSAINPVYVMASTVIVEAGDTLSDIAQRNNVTLTELIRVNRIQDSNELTIGQKILIPNSNAKITTKSINYNIIKGDTLNSIAKQFGTTEKELIKLNQIENSNYLFEGQVLQIPVNNKKLKPNNVIHTVIAGDTLAEISITYNSNSQEISRVNNLKDPNSLFPGQKLKIPTSKKINSAINASRANYHILSEGDTLFSIASTYQVPLETILKLNKISNPDQLDIGTKVRLRNKTSSNKIRISNQRKSKKEPEWRTYGPLKINWSSWKPLGGSFVTPTLNKDGKALYLAINCNAKKINATGPNGTWKNWIKPIDKFEHDLIKDLCKDKRS